MKILTTHHPSPRVGNEILKSRWEVFESRFWSGFLIWIQISRMLIRFTWARAYMQSPQIVKSLSESVWKNTPTLTLRNFGAKRPLEMSFSRSWLCGASRSAQQGSNVTKDLWTESWRKFAKKLVWGHSARWKLIIDHQNFSKNHLLKIRGFRSNLSFQKNTLPKMVRASFFSGGVFPIFPSGLTVKPPRCWGAHFSRSILSSTLGPSLSHSQGGFTLVVG